MKTCKICKQTKPVSAFYLLEPNRHDSYCKECRIRYQRYWRKVVTAPKPCAFPGCEEDVGRNRRWYCDHHGELAKIGKLVLPKTQAELPPMIDRNHPCAKCSALVLCKAEIWRATFTPPCMVESRHYDSKLARKVWKIQEAVDVTAIDDRTP